MKSKISITEMITLTKFPTENERKHLRILAGKITKVPQKINIPTEYMISND